MYKEPIRISENDLLCSTTSLEGTVIGILFEKSGEEIKGAITARIKEIDSEIDRHVNLLAPIRDFLKEKENVIEIAEKTEKEENEKKDELLNPLKKEREVINNKILKLSLKHDKQADVLFEKIEEEFSKGWDGLASSFGLVDKENNKDKWKIPGEKQTYSWGENKHGQLGVSSSSNSSSSASFCSPVYCPVDWRLPVSNGLKKKLSEYRSNFEQIKSKIEELNNEKRKLEIISRNICSDRKFKLSLEQLSAFGFEDIKVE